MIGPKASIVALADLATRAASVANMLVGWLVLVGHALGIATLTRVMPGLPEMAPNTAFALMLSGMSLWLLAPARAGRHAALFGRACATVVVLIGLFTLVEDLSGRSLGIDAWLVDRGHRAIRGMVVRPPPSAAVCLVLVGSALLSMDVTTRRGQRPAEYLSIVAAFISLMAVTAYAYGARARAGVPAVLPYTGMALHTAMAVAVLCGGILCARPREGLMAIVTSDGTGGVTVRRLLPAAVAVPVVIGLFASLVYRAGLQDLHSAFALITAVTAVGGIGLLMATGASLDRVDLGRRRAEQERTALLAREQLALAQAQAERAWLQAVLEHAAQGIVFIEAANERVYANPAARRLLGWSEKALLTPADLLSQVCTTEGRPLRPEELPSSVALRGETMLQKELQLVRPDGQSVPVLVTASPVLLADGRVGGAVVIFQDITARKELDRLRDEYLGLISHDLRAPLTAIILQAELLVRMLRGTGQEREIRTAEAIVSNGKRMNTMIQELLEVTRLESGRVELHREELDLVSLVARVIETVVSPPERDRIRIEVLSAPLPVWVDRDRIERVVINLVTNALQYSTPGTPIVVRLERDCSEAVAAVMDQGPGIAASDLPRLFEKYRRLGGERRGQGLGLGLYISKLIVEAHGGRIGAESTVGVGSRFYFRLPLVEEAKTVVAG